MRILSGRKKYTAFKILSFGFIFFILALLNGPTSVLAINPTTPTSPGEPGAPNGTFCFNNGNYDSSCASGYCSPDQVCAEDPRSCAFTGCQSGDACDLNSGSCVPACIVNGCSSGSLCNRENGRCEALIDSVTPGPSGNLCAQRTEPCGAGTVCSPTNGQCIPIISPGTSPGSSYPVGGGNLCGGDPELVYVDGVCLPKDSACTEGGLTCSNGITDFIVKIIQLLLGLAGVIAVLILVVGGFWYLASAGNEETAEKGKKTIINAIIGLVVIILSYALVSIISSTLMN